MKEIVCSGALFYSLKTKRFLFLHRASGKHNKLWGLVGGTNEGAETPWEGLQREITEEIGLAKPDETLSSDGQGTGGQRSFAGLCCFYRYR